MGNVTINRQAVTIWDSREPEALEELDDTGSSGVRGEQCPGKQVRGQSGCQGWYTAAGCASPSFFILRQVPRIFWALLGQPQGCSDKV